MDEDLQRWLSQQSHEAVGSRPHFIVTLFSWHCVPAVSSEGLAVLRFAVRLVLEAMNLEEGEDSDCVVGICHGMEAADDSRAQLQVMSIQGTWKHIEEISHSCQCAPCSAITGQTSCLEKKLKHFSGTPEQSHVRRIRGTTQGAVTWTMSSRRRTHTPHIRLLTDVRTNTPTDPHANEHGHRATHTLS